jgi:hypothetical protein
MIGQRIGYVRVSSFDQNPERQLEQVAVDRVFTDTASGKDTRRLELERLLAFVREGDTVVVHSMDRLARNLDDLRRLVQDLTRHCHRARSPNCGSASPSAKPRPLLPAASTSVVKPYIRRCGGWRFCDDFTSKEAQTIVGL